MNKFFLLLLLSLKAFGSQDESPIYIQLETEAKLLPLYQVKLADENSGLPKEYLSQLEKILRFDLSHNGMTYLVENSAQKENLASALSFDKASDLSAWMKEKTYFIIQARVKDRKLGAALHIVNSNSKKLIDGLELTGVLSKDRSTIHVLADAIHKALFQTDGIATTKILYTVKTGGENGKKAISEVFESDYDGGNPRQITNSRSYAVTPCYIPPRTGRISRSFLYVSYEIGQPKIYIGDLETGKTQRLSLLKGNQLMPAISSQRDQIAFISDVTGNPDLFLQSFDAESGLINKPRQLYATYKATQGTPTFSPDGKKIAFVSNKDGSPKIYIIDIPPSGTPLKEIKARLITKINRENSAPNWSPDGKKLAYCATAKGVRQIWIYDFETGKEHQLTQGPGNKENPSFAPNSLHLVFNSTDANASDLYIVNLNQPEAAKINTNKSEHHFPSWEPRALKE